MTSHPFLTAFFRVIHILVCGASFPLFITQMNERLTIQGANSLLAGLTLLLAPLPVLFKWKGAALRERAAKRRQIVS